MERSLKKITVQAFKDTQGRWMPQHFYLEGWDYKVIGVGRRWQDEEGEHILVQDMRLETFELVLSPDETTWYIKPRRRHTVR
jgi:hypothetical protein